MDYKNIFILKKYFPFIVGVVSFQLIFWIIAYKMQSIYLVDSYEYLFQVDNLKNLGTWYAGDIQIEYDLNLVSKRPPFYAVFILLIKNMVNSDYMVLLVQNLLSIVNLMGVLILFSNFQIRINIKFQFFMLLLVFFSSQLIYSNLIMSEMLLQTVLFWAFFLFVQFIRKGKPIFIIGYNILLSIGILTKPVLYLFCLPNLILLFILFIKIRNNKMLCLTPFIPVLCIIIVCYHNMKETDYFHYSSIKTFNLLHYNTYRTLLRNHSNEVALETVNGIIDSANLTTNFKEYSQIIELESLRIIWENKVNYLVCHFSGMLNYFLDPGRFDLYNFLKIEPEGNVGMLYFFLNMVILVLYIIFFLYQYIRLYIWVLFLFSIFYCYYLLFILYPFPILIALLKHGLF